MNIGQYCKQKGFSKEEYNNLKGNIKEVAAAIRSNLKYNNGMYYKVDRLFKHNTDPTIKAFIIDELKKLDIEFYDGNKLYRVCS